ncbi:MAG TPA: 50S ribosomal protein L11 methyltransferase [Polyangia bacterium]|nr:50S ribosomal protein L11 methyltransferase [Polyangia bacterium]
MTEVWAELLVDAPAAVAEAVAAYLSLRGDGVEVRDAETLVRPARPGRVELLAYVRPEEAEARSAELKSRFADLAITRRQRSEDEWRDVWKQWFKARRVGRRIVIRPSWEPGDVKPGDVVVELDPGRAFGTGSHESTQLVLEAMEDLPAPVRFLDVGSGSGILSIAAAALWPDARGVAIDTDPEAVACTRENLARNHVVGRVEASDRSLGDIEGRFEVVLANLTAEILFEIMVPLAARVAPGGMAVLSGMLRDFADAVAARFQTQGLRIVRLLDCGEWRAAQLERPG